MGDGIDDNFGVNQGTDEIDAMLGTTGAVATGTAHVEVPYTLRTIVSGGYYRDARLGPTGGGTLTVDIARSKHATFGLGVKVSDPKGDTTSGYRGFVFHGDAGFGRTAVGFL